MARRSPQRVVTTLVGLAALAVLAAAVPCRERIAAAWHLYRLRTDPGHLERILERPEALGRDHAIRRFLESAAGRERFLEAFLALHEGSIRAGELGYVRSALPPAVLAVAGGTWRMATPGYAVGEIILLGGMRARPGALIAGGFSTGSAGSLEDCPASAHPQHRRLEGMQPYLGVLRGPVFTSARFPGHRFQLLPGDEAGLRSGLYVAPSTGTFGRIDVPEDRPPPWMSTADLEALREATALLIEVDRDEARETTR